MVATDTDGKITTGEASLFKDPPYTPFVRRGIADMPFDGDYRGLIAFQNATEVGQPEYFGKWYDWFQFLYGGPNSYLIFPITGLMTP